VLAGEFAETVQVGLEAPREEVVLILAQLADLEVHP
jgi:hypothetical protein